MKWQERLAVAVWNRTPVRIQNWVYDRNPRVGRRLDELADIDDLITVTEAALCIDHHIRRRPSSSQELQ